MTINRHKGRVCVPGLPFMYGAGVEGATAELDNLVARAAKMLSEHFGSDIQIRFNTDRRSGGAWLPCGDYSAIGLCADLCWTCKCGHQAKDHEYDPDAPLINVTVTTLRLGHCARCGCLGCPRYQEGPDTIRIRTFIGATCLGSAPADMKANMGPVSHRYHNREHKTLAAGLRWLERYAVVSL